jgi:uncharacterized repeat protein (TIGR03803 family)
MTKTVQAFETRLRALSMALAFTIVLLPALAAAPAGQAQTYKVLHRFTGGADGGRPYAGLIRDAGGDLYGTTYSGGGSKYGTVFKVAGDGKETVLYSFTGSPDGAAPSAGLIRDPAGDLYGTTVDGGASDVGTVFKAAADGKETVLYSFCSAQNCTDGAYPVAGLVRDASGALYGTASGGTYYGVVFKLAASGKETVLHNFTGPPRDGAGPGGGFLVRDANGDLYGTTQGGGASDVGTVFKVAADGKETVLYSFCSAQNCADGAYPGAGLVQDSKGNLYGTTQGGGDLSCYSDGAYGCGVVFKLAPNGKETVLHSFTGSPSDGAGPGRSFLVRDANGDLYGTTASGGVSDVGTVFKVAADGKETVLYSFAGSDGAYPYAGLVRDAKGNLYGTTERGGGYGYGTVFELIP